jgi:chitosanase
MHPFFEMLVRMQLIGLAATATAFVLAAGTAPGVALPNDAWLTAEQKTRADALISMFENDTPFTRYDYHEVLGDGRGMTLGRGFTTATGDALLVVRAYSSRVPGNGLATSIPLLEQLAAEGIPSDDARLPSTLGDDWAAAAINDPTFRIVQDEISDGNAYQPAMQLADAQLDPQVSALGRFILYDTVFMHGNGPDPDGAPALVALTIASTGRSREGGDAEEWWTTFLNARRADLLNPANPATREEWARAVGRINMLLRLVQAHNWSFAGPIDVDEGGFTPATIP